MAYDPPVYPAAIPSEEDLPDYEDDRDWVTADKFNALKKELRAALIELGTLPKGDYADVKTRLAIYSKGSYEPTLVGSTSGSYTLTGDLNRLAWTKTGRIVHIQGMIGIEGHNNPVGIIRLSLPFTSADLPEGEDMSIAQVFFRNQSISLQNPLGVIGRNVAYIEFYTMTDAGSMAAIVDLTLGANFYIYMNATYIIAE